MALRMKTHTEFDLEHLEELQRVITSEMNARAVKRSRTFNIAWGSLSLACAGLALWQTHSVVSAVILVILGTIFLCRGIFYYKLAAMGIRMTMAKSSVSSDYILEKSWLLAMDAQGSHQFPYDQCDRLLETENNLYYIMKDGQGLMLDKLNLKGGSQDDLRAWMEEKCGKKVEWKGKNPRTA